MTPPILELHHAGRIYPGTPPVIALRDVTLNVFPGELIAVVGPSGSGKSTLLHLLGTLDRPSTGTVRVAGHDVSAITDRQLAGLRGRQIGFVFQQFVLLPRRSALDNVAMPLLYQGISAGERRRRAATLLDQVGLAERSRHLPGQLSGGEQQRVAIARALAARPAVILADEPTGNLDTTSGAGILALLRDVARSGTAVVVVTHDKDLAGTIGRHLLVRDGQVTQP